MSKFHGIAPRHPGLWRHHERHGLCRVETLQSTDLGFNELQACATKLAQLSQQGRWIVLINAPKFEYKQMLAQAGVRLDRILLVRTKDEVDTLWAMERALTSGTSSAVITWTTPLDERDNRRMQLVAKSARAYGWLIEDVNAYSPQNCRPTKSEKFPIRFTAHNFH